jgi:tight adherence protein C
VSPQILTALGAVFLSVALLVGIGVSIVLRRSSAGRRRLSALTEAATTIGLVVADEGSLEEVVDPGWNRLLNLLPTSRGSVKRLRRDMGLAGFDSARAGAMLSMAELVLPILLGLAPILMLTGVNRWIAAVFGALIGYLGPGFLLGLRIKKRKKQIENGIADTLDLLVLCLEAGSSLDQAIVKASEELGVAYQALGDQLHILISEMRAGKSRLDAFRGFAERTQVDDVRALVAMLIQTDRFGTSVAQALRTHAGVCRTKRRQRAEERAQKVGVKLVFPLVFCLFPALYVVMLGPAYLQFVKVFMGAI